MRRLLLALLFTLAAVVPAFAQATAGATFIFGQYTFTGLDGVTPLDGGKLCAFAAGSATPHDTWVDSGLLVKNANPVILNGAGRANSGGIYLDGTNYKFQLLTPGTTTDCSTGTTVWTMDNVEDLANVFFNTKQAANTVYAGPVSGATAIPAFRTLVAADLPNAIVTTTATGTQANFAPGLVGNYTTVLCNNAALLTITGISGGTAGQRVRFISKGAGIVGFSHQAGGSTAANRLINNATSADTSIQAGLGSVEYVYDGVTARWRLSFHNQGGWITPTFAAGHYTAGGAQTWTVIAGNATDYSYYLSGNQLAFQVTVQNSSVGGVPATTLLALVPGGFTIGTGEAELANLVNDNAGGFATGNTELVAGRTVLTFYKSAALTANWTGSVTSTSVFASGVMLVQ